MQTTVTLDDDTLALIHGLPMENLDRALQVAAELEDEELIRRQRRGA